MAAPTIEMPGRDYMDHFRKKPTKQQVEEHFEKNGTKEKLKWPWCIKLWK